jgi:iron complex outermembrane receptor protein
MRLCRLIGLVVTGCLCTVICVAQTVRGKVVDKSTGEPMFAASVLEKGTVNGAVTDYEGEFSIALSKLPTVLLVKYIGYQEQEIPVNSVDSRLTIELEEGGQQLGSIEVFDTRITEKQKQAPLTVETMDLIAIKQTPSGSFYEGLGSLKGVDMTTASLGFRIINTRGFNSTSPVRTLQVIDGVDNQSPGLNFSLGNFLGAPDLDVKAVEIVQGASSAFFGPGAFNGVVNMETKNPFQFDGLSAQLRVGERGLVEPSVRWAQKFKNDKDQEFIAYKLNVYYLRANDWEADSEMPIFGSEYGVENAGRFDAVNVYGDEYFPANDFSGSPPWTTRGLGNFFRTGYREADVVDYNTRNLKANAAMHLRLKPELESNSPELIVGGNVGTGTTVYQGDNRFSLRNILFYQGKVELRKKNKYFLRAYATAEDAGDSYDPYFTALQIQDAARSDEDWAKVYKKYWDDVVDPRIDELGYPGLVFVPGGGITFDYDALAAWQTQYQDSLVAWHNLVENLTNTGNAGIPTIAENGFFEPGSEDFNDAFNRITALKNNEGEGGTRFFDRSALFHAQGEYQLEDKWFIDHRFGANVRLYRPNSDGTIFSDTTSRISNNEFGIYYGASRKFLEDRLTATGTLRLDKNQNFDPVISPALSLVYQPVPRHYVRASFSSALRNPTLSDQYLFLNVGPAILSGNLNGVDSLATLESFGNWRNSLNPNDIDYFNIDPIRPERVRTFEVGYRGTLGNKIYVDAGTYFSQYTDFIGFNIGIEGDFGAELDFSKPFQVYRYAANSNNTVTTQGFNVGVNYYYFDVHSFNANYSWNKIVKSSEDDPIIPAFNTPEHKFNVGISARDWLKSKDGNSWGYNVNYKWIEGFLFEGSPQFTGNVPTYDLLDAMISYTLAKRNTTFKVGASNVLNNMQIQTYGGPRIGRLAYFSILYEMGRK